MASGPRRHTPSSDSDRLWPVDKRPNAVSGGGGDSSPRDVASMKAEIAELQAGTTASLDRAIAAAQATASVGSRTQGTLKEQREQMGEIDADARAVDATLKRTGHNLKYGLNWRGALTSTFRRKKPPARAGGGGINTGGGDISPVFKDDFRQSTPPGGAPAHGGNTSSTPSPKKGGRFKFGSSRNKAGAASAEETGTKAASKLPANVPEGFETQLDTLDSLLDGLTVQAKEIGAELKQQNEGIEVLGARVEPLRQETASQAKQIKRRFGVKG
ncbi:unnamed protein product [Ectocarpus fasciculatus]